MRNRIWLPMACSWVALVVPLAAGAQDVVPNRNLQVLPMETPREVLLSTMADFAQALGVRCVYCHVEPGPGGTLEQLRLDRPKDDKAPKRTARVMMRMVNEINTKLQADLGKSAADLTRVRCVTCHRGVAIPKQITEILTQTATARGVPAAIEQYRDLRKRYFGAQSYDFSETALIEVAQRLNEAGKPDEALAFLGVNSEFYPRSAPTYVAMAQSYIRKSDRNAAREQVERALNIDPQNAQAKQLLEKVKAPQ